ncbi:hypothetical protein HGM15179_018397 [Zosterops borbonicus]|uniref:Uncharacterized protein n=1 Tax=Zosterops borbonicus TaxID=364589 RepID=A0A8K1FZ57_9PASS|nr:hypothetical protein HGM15179_018397 [Zosterops borbonicus]
MKVAVLSVALLFSILLCLPSQSKATDGSGEVICAGIGGGYENGQVPEHNVIFEGLGCDIFGAPVPTALSVLVPITEM